MRIEQFAYLQEVAREQSISSAGKVLHMTPQALSQAIKSLEDELEIKLLERSHHGVSLTARGRSVIEAAERFRLELADIKGGKDEGASKTLGAKLTILATKGVQYFMPRLATELYLSNPDLQISLVECDYREALEAILSGQNEIALNHICIVNQKNIFEFDEQQLVFYPLAEFRYYCVANCKLPLADYKTISMKTLLNYPLIVYGDDSQYSMMSMIRQFGEPKKVIFTQHYKMLEELVAAGVGAGIRFQAVNRAAMPTKHSTLVSIKINDDFRTQYGFVIKRDGFLSDQTKALIDFLKSNKELWLHEND